MPPSSECSTRSGGRLYEKGCRVTCAAWIPCAHPFPAVAAGPNISRASSATRYRPCCWHRPAGGCQIRGETAKSTARIPHSDAESTTVGAPYRRPPGVRCESRSPLRLHSRQPFLPFSARSLKILARSVSKPNLVINDSCRLFVRNACDGAPALLYAARWLSRIEWGTIAGRDPSEGLPAQLLTTRTIPPSTKEARCWFTHWGVLHLAH